MESLSDIRPPPVLPVRGISRSCVASYGTTLEICLCLCTLLIPLPFLPVAHHQAVSLCHSSPPFADRLSGLCGTILSQTHPT